MPITILLVEDEPGIRSVTAKWLAHHGYAVDEAENGKEGWECIQQRAPDLVITDIAMPEMDGVELCRLIKTTESTADIPVLMFTSHAEADLQLAGTKAGADAYIPKNGDLRVLNARIEALAAARSRARQETERTRRLTLSQSVTTLAHHINNSVIAIHATASVVDPNNPQQAQKLRHVCQTEARKMLLVLKALKEMAEREELKTTVYVGNELMFDLEAALRQLDSGAKSPPR
ncbi:MAG TPA: response regulator [Candidatus Latescibacteria bacterium]|nr:response regulator [Candidatus Latescibacterota bacterium]HQI77755.1 response regulator [Candidatus Latescibacterota bacterium]